MAVLMGHGDHVIYPFHLAQFAMPKASAMPTSEGTGSGAGDRQNLVAEPDAQTRKTDEWWRTVFEVGMQIESPELKEKFSGVVLHGDHKGNYQVCCTFFINWIILIKRIAEPAARAPGATE